MFRLALLSILITAGSVSAQEQTIFDYIRDHASVVSGVASANGERSEYVSISVDDDFLIRPRLHGTAGISLFGRQRVAGGSDSPLPLSLDELALYSAGELQGGIYFDLAPKIALEARAGVTFDMIGITGKVGDPVDPSKFLLGAGLRLTGGPGRLSLLVAHYGAVDEGTPFLGFVPTGYFDGEFRLPRSTSVIIRIAAGRQLITEKAVTSSWFAVRKGF